MTKFPAKLLAGHTAFKNGGYDNERDRYRDLASVGQKPQAMVIACCDSRAAPETVFNAGPGEMFVIRNVANLVPSYFLDEPYNSTPAALEYAVQVLKIKHILVMGHSLCGGIKAALDPGFEPLSPGDFIGKWIRPLAPVVQSITGNDRIAENERQTALEQASIRQSVKNLLTFPYILPLVQKQQLQVHGAWFDIASGELWVMDDDTENFYRPDIAS